GATRDQTLVHRVRLQALDRLDADDALVLRLVREQRRSGHVADGIDAGDVGAIERIDDYGAAFGLHAELFQPEILDIADDPNRGDDAFGRHGLRAALAVVDGRGNAIRFLVELGHLRAGEDLDPLFLELLAGKGRNLGVLGGENLRQHLDHRDLRAEGP